MRRRVAAPAEGAVPARLARFVPDEWPGASEWQRYEQWSAAVDEWTLDHPELADLVDHPAEVEWDPAIDLP